MEYIAKWIHKAWACRVNIVLPTDGTVDTDGTDDIDDPIDPTYGTDDTDGTDDIDDPIGTNGWHC